MRLDGSKEIDTAKVEDGVTKSFAFPKGYGPKGGVANLEVTFKWAGGANQGFMRQVEAFQAGRGVETFREVMGSDEFTGIMYDHCVVDWKTDLQSGGEAIEASRENFLWLCQMTSVYTKEAADKGLYSPDAHAVMVQVLTAFYDQTQFYKAAQKATGKN